MPDVAIVTCAALPDLEADEATLLPRLRELGVDAVPVVWDDPGVDWDAFAASIVRCPWDYQHRLEEFQTWAAKVPRLHNPAEVLTWNTDKRYLAELAARGVPVVPTTWIDPGQDIELPSDGDWVLKPSVGAGSTNAGRYRLGSVQDAELAAAHAARLHRLGNTVMVQPYLSDVDVNGEKSLIYIAGEYSHAIRKSAMLDGPSDDTERLFKEETIAAATASKAEQAIAESVLAAIPGLVEPVLYARIDLIQGDSGLLVLELELTEPSLFYGYSRDGAERMATAIAARI